MKTSHYLLLAVAVLSLTGMVATDVLLKREYGKINWADKYQFFARRTLPTINHLVVTGVAERTVLLGQGRQPQALVNPEDSAFFRTRQMNDTLYVMFNPDSVNHESPRANTWYEAPTGLILQLPELKSVRVINTRLLVEKQPLPTPSITLQNSILTLRQKTGPTALQLVAQQNSYALIDKGNYRAVQLTVQDSSAVHFNDVRMDAFTPTLSDKAEVQFKGQSLTWIK